MDTSTRVYVYLVDPDSGQTLDFMAFGSLVTDRHVVLHHGRVQEDDPQQPSKEQAETLTLPRPGVGGPVRCLVVDDVGLEVIDGRALTDRQTPLEPPTGVRLNAPSACATDPVTLPPGLELPDDVVREAYEAYLAAVSLDDPEAPPYPAPRRQPLPPDPEDPPQGRKPWYCSIWPGAVGCG